MKALSRLIKGFENAMSAVTFAEAGEYETARQILRSGDDDHSHDENNCHAGNDLKTHAVTGG